MKNIFALFILLPMLLIAAPKDAEALIYPDPTTSALLYGDFYSYSLPVLAYLYDRDVDSVGTGPTNPYYVASGPGQIKDGVVIATGSTGKPVNENFAGMDDAYPTPNSSGTSEFSTGTTTDPDPALPYDREDTWDTTISALTNYLDGGMPFFYFNNNQENSGDSLNQNLWVWGQIELWSSAATADPIYFELVSHLGGGAGEFAGEFGGDPYTYLAHAYSDANWDPTQFDDYILSGGDVCLDGNDAPVSCDSEDVAFGPEPHNLGADQAAYAVMSPELNDFLSEWSDQSMYDMMSIDIRMHSLNSGYEQAFILSDTVLEPRTVVPEPTTWMLMGIGLLGLFFIRRMRQA
ncbi:MAG: hypothetical protein CL942_12735 [Desulfovibrio sp.]|nr:hypothetical protein [Desulfovibrio sp.]|tara:strand:+ start:5552 stop:6595 length:1044 start_codon:yes stop_codon:yes gene_type:complete